MAIHNVKVAESKLYVSPRDGVTRWSYVPKTVIRRHTFMTGGMMRHGSWVQEKRLPGFEGRTIPPSAPKPVTVRRQGKVVAFVVP